METNAFLYSRDARNNVRPQHEDMFSSPEDHVFFQKVKKHLETPRTDACLEECFRQLDAHAKIPLQAQRFMRDPAFVESFRAFFDNAANERWRATLTEILVHLFDNRQALLFGDKPNQVKDDILGIVFDYMLQHPDLVTIIWKLWQNQALVDQNEAFYQIKFEEYLAQSLQNPKLRKRVGTVCKCLQILSLTTLNQQANCLRLMEQYVLDILACTDLPATEAVACMEYIQACVGLDSKICCYLVQKDFPVTLMKLLNHYDAEVQLMALTIVASTIQHFPQSLVFYRDKQEEIAQAAAYLATSGSPDILVRVAMEIQRMRDGPLRGSYEFDSVIERLKVRGAWGGLDGDY